MLAGARQARRIKEKYLRAGIPLNLMQRYNLVDFLFPSTIYLAEIEVSSLGLSAWCACSLKIVLAVLRQDVAFFDTAESGGELQTGINVDTVSVKLTRLCISHNDMIKSKLAILTCQWETLRPH